jgi:hypothetical protein
MADRWTMRPQQSQNLSHSPQGVLRLNGRELLFGEAKRSVTTKFTPLANLGNRQASPFGVM